jgi:hypothetical protein
MQMTLVKEYSVRIWLLWLLSSPKVLSSSFCSAHCHHSRMVGEDGCTVSFKDRID